ncbi:hypothetical protein SAMN05660772_02770 [Pasteurella testudinis DSM 23072]|uniref:Uncharacterized protein n=1 Tax=Pasteurella testudinis DSM 23072 TaxID=1122938 RepID=A0A1W1V3F7_9PAST|nr:hypothetical protein [Pasteurella testudinis]SMB87927.1 hypothetical protein SAMN05660772_02770 [Pasteurella testudinis DSM 23072]SUB52182.1 Uncharacterised protein [Pasteurella testudinis]
MKNKIIAYELSGIDNHSYFYECAPKETFCSTCHSCINYQYYPNNFHIKNKADFSFAYDGGPPIISAKFKYFIENLGYPIQFDCLNPEGSLFTLIPEKKLTYLAMQQSEYCNKCNQYVNQIAPIPNFSNEIQLPISDGFFRSDMKFGSGIEKGFIVILGVNTGNLIKKAQKELKLRGLDLIPITL